MLMFCSSVWSERVIETMATMGPAVTLGVAFTNLPGIICLHWAQGLTTFGVAWPNYNISSKIDLGRGYRPECLHCLTSVTKKTFKLILSTRPLSVNSWFYVHLIGNLIITTTESRLFPTLTSCFALISKNKHKHVQKSFKKRLFLRDKF